MLAAQAVTCNAVFTDCISRAQRNYQSAEVFDRLMRFGLRAQNQSRASIESLAVIQNPPTIFAKQANVSNGPQQVNNGVPSIARAEKLDSSPNKLLETDTHVERIEGVDAGAATTAAGGDSGLATVAPVQRAKKHPG